MLKKISEILLLITLIFNLEIFSLDMRTYIKNLDMNTIYLAEDVERMRDIIPTRADGLDNINTSWTRAYSACVAGDILYMHEKGISEFSLELQLKALRELLISHEQAQENFQKIFPPTSCINQDKILNKILNMCLQIKLKPYKADKSLNKFYYIPNMIKLIEYIIIKVKIHEEKNCCCIIL